ncbi:NusA-like transcription termination signal-binding factor [archaeon]
MKLGMDELQYISIIEKITRAKVKDCVLTEGELVVVVGEGEMGLAIGRNGENAEKVREAVGKKVSFIEFSPDQEKFIKKLFAPAVIESVEVDGETVKLKARESQRVIGKGGKRKKRAETLLERHFGIKNVVIN